MQGGGGAEERKGEEKMAEGMVAQCIEFGVGLAVSLSLDV